MTQPNVLSRVQAAARAAEDKKGEDILALDVRGQSTLTDYFLFVSGISHIHIRAIEDAIRESLRDTGAVLARTDGQRGHLWRALDYGSFIVHVMDRKTREFYAMERLWERARPVNLDSTRPKKKPAKSTRKPARKSSRRPAAKRKRKS